MKKRDERMFIMNNSSENGGGLMSVITLIAAAGSVIGSLLFPGIGTVIGSVDMLYKTNAFENR